MPTLPKLSRAVRLWLSGVFVALAVTCALWLGGLLSTAARLAAFATMVLAVGTTGLAVGAIGTYMEQRRANAQQAREIQRQALALDQRRINEIAQVFIERFMDSDGFGAVRVRNHTARAIRNVYVWIEVHGMTGRYHLAVKKDLGAGTDEMWRGMENVPRGAAGGADLYWRLRTILPGNESVFEQIRFMHDNQPIAVMRDSDVTALAEFADSEGQWWRSNEDGEVNPAPEPREVTTQPHPLQTGLPGGTAAHRLTPRADPGPGK